MQFSSTASNSTVSIPTVPAKRIASIYAAYAERIASMYASYDINSKSVFIPNNTMMSIRVGNLSELLL
jgi:hypothetical protein